MRRKRAAVSLTTAHTLILSGISMVAARLIHGYSAHLINDPFVFRERLLSL